MNRALLLLALGPLLCSPAHAQATKYDGAWNVTMTCPPHHDDDDVKGYPPLTGRVCEFRFSR